MLYWIAINCTSVPNKRVTDFQSHVRSSLQLTDHKYSRYVEIEENADKMWKSSPKINMMNGHLDEVVFIEHD